MTHVSPKAVRRGSEPEALSPDLLYLNDNFVSHQLLDSAKRTHLSFDIDSDDDDDSDSENNAEKDETPKHSGEVHRAVSHRKRREIKHHGVKALLFPLRASNFAAKIRSPPPASKELSIVMLDSEAQVDAAPSPAKLLSFTHGVDGVVMSCLVSTPDPKAW
ncbi:hypothetical protein ACHHYP_09964 [Achlya hypogyna]|uniref:Uncharacterized protein n=1 Tax=Achlya hypogyna TaxID=1202772 RepID=A0A1V9YM23_ACHHY|nr:hypothetical protein ACHHYP_09964 [Achlya hypogyna]